MGWRGGGGGAGGWNSPSTLLILHASIAFSAWSMLVCMCCEEVQACVLWAGWGWGLRRGGDDGTGRLGGRGGGGEENATL